MTSINSIFLPRCSWLHTILVYLSSSISSPLLSAYQLYIDHSTYSQVSQHSTDGTWGRPGLGETYCAPYLLIRLVADSIFNVKHLMQNDLYDLIKTVREIVSIVKSGFQFVSFRQSLVPLRPILVHPNLWVGQFRPFYLSNSLARSPIHSTIILPCCKTLLCNLTTIGPMTSA